MIPLLISHHAAHARTAFLNFHPQSSSDCRHPLTIQHPFAQARLQPKWLPPPVHSLLGTPLFQSSSVSSRVLCAVLISCVFRVWLIQKEKTVPRRYSHNVPHERSRHCLKSVIATNAACFVPLLNSLSISTVHSEITSSMETSVDSYSLSSRIFSFRP